jgi:putative nucleotidyltransferase with HDIG domain
VVSPLLRHALTEPGELACRMLPDRVGQLVQRLAAPPRLAAHLRIVHDVAWQLTDRLTRDFPALRFDREAVLFGAASHDIGKVVYPQELSGPGHAHETAGYELLRRHGVDERLARFARTHAAWTAPEVTAEDLLVSVADKIWKGRRVEDLERLVADRLVPDRDAGVDRWQVLIDVDDFLEDLATDADQRLAFQAAYPVTSPA